MVVFVDNKKEFVMRNRKGVPTLPELRKELDKITRHVIRLFAKRDAVVEQVATRKKLDGIPIVRDEVEKRCFSDIRAYAERLGFDPEVACAVFLLMLTRAYKVEIEHIQQKGV